MPRITYEDRLNGIRRAELGSAAEVMTRAATVGFAGLALWVVSGQWLTLVWLAVHMVLQALNALLLQGRFALSARETFRASVTVYSLSALNFAAYPLMLLAENTTSPLIAAGVAALVGQTIYILQRQLLDRTIVAVDVMTMSAVSLTLITLLLPTATTAAETALVILVPLSITCYIFVALFSGMRQQKLLRETQARYATSQKARALNQFVGGVAHDFNNQLTAILGHLELFEMLEEPDERQLALDESRRAAHRAALTVRQLLASSGRTRLCPEPLALAGFLQNLQTVLSSLLEPGMRVTFVAPSEQDQAWVDADMLETCMIQLCLNAQDATEGKGKIRIWVESHDTLPPQDPPIESAPPYTVIYVEDNGRGVPQEALPMLAEPFYTTKRRHEGAGLGLSAVSGFARQSGGTLTITAAPLAGLRLALALPARAPQHPRPDSKHPKRRAAASRTDAQPSQNSALLSDRVKLRAH